MYKQGPGVLLQDQLNIPDSEKLRLSGAVDSTVTLQQPASRLQPLCVEFACSPRACVGFLRVLQFPPTFQRHAGWKTTLNCP